MAVTEAPEIPALTTGDAPLAAPRPRGVSNVATALFVAADFIALCALVAGYYAVRSQAFKWPPVNLGTYLPTMIALTMLMTAVTIHWAIWAIRRNDQRTTLAALGITIFFALAVLNGQWYELAHLNFGIGAHAYGTFVYVLTGFHMAQVMLGIVLLVALFVRAVGAEFHADDHDSITTAAIFWQFANVAGLLAYAVLFVHP